MRKNGGIINNGAPPPERSLAATSSHGSSNALPSVMESDDSYLIPSAGPKQRFAVELEGGEKKLAERQELSKAVASAAKALSEVRARGTAGVKGGHVQGVGREVGRGWLNGTRLGYQCDQLQAQMLLLVRVRFLFYSIACHEHQCTC